MMIGSNLANCLVGRVYDKMSLYDGNVTEIVSKFPYPSSLPFNIDVQKSPLFEMLCLYQAWSIGLFGLLFNNCNIIITGIMIHLTAQFRMLNNSLTNVVERSEKITYGVSDCK